MLCTKKISKVLGLCITAMTSYAYASEIQMLPPVTEASETATPPVPCPQGSTSSVLTWDGTHPIACAQGITASEGNVTASGTISPGNFKTGDACPTEGALAYDNTSHAPIYCNQQLKWSNVGIGGAAGSLSGWCHSQDWYGIEALSPAYLNGYTCTCPTGYTLVKTGEGGVAEFYTMASLGYKNVDSYFSCHKD